MANEVQILIKAVDQASGTLKKINGELTKSGTTAQSVAGKFKALLSSPTAMIGVVGAVTGAMTAAGVAVKGLADDFQDYAFQVQDFGRIIGATPEEASKLIQVADDVRLSVGSMTAAMRAAITKGYTPSIQGLGEMADAYNAIKEPLEKSRYLVETFGRSGLEMAKLLELGSAKIQEMGDSIENTGLLMTQSGVDAATEYYQAIDTLGDSWTSLTQILGREAVPVLTDAVNWLNNFVAESQKAAAATNDLETAVALGLISAEEYQDAINRLSIKDTELYDILKNKAVPIMEEYRQKYKDILPDMAEMILKTTNLGKAVDVMSMSVDTSVGTLDAFGQSAADAGDGFSRLADGIKRAQADYDKFLKGKRTLDLEARLNFKMPDITGQIEAFFDKSKWEAAGGAALEAAFGKVNEAVANGAITQTQAGIVFNSLYVEAQKIQVALGNITADQAAENVRRTLGGSLEDALALVTEIRNKASFDVTSYLTVEVTYKTGTGKGVGKTNVELDLIPDNFKGPGGANGLNMIVPPGFPNDTFPVRASSGEQVTITPQSRGGGGGNNVTVNVYPTPGQSETAIANAVIRKINQSMRAGSRSGLGYTG